MSGSGVFWTGVGFLGLALGVAAGAFGAHALQGSLDAENLQRWDTATRYLVYGFLGITLAGLAATVWPDASWGPPLACLFLGTAVFSGTVGSLALGGPRWLGAVTPVGGTLMIVAYAWIGWTVLRRVG
ncbi:MAG: DUF423 domain-containing protein [Thermoanaerobaculia bacterium]|nr:DUF423 domain-containing protein [Thermoanaerobaculia bacterium]